MAMLCSKSIAVCNRSLIVIQLLITIALVGLFKFQDATFLLQPRNITYHVVLSQPRSGSTFISQLLSSHPCIINLEENLRLGDNEVRTYNTEQFSGFHQGLKTMAVSKQATKSKNPNCTTLAIGWKQFLFESPTIRPLNNFIFKIGPNNTTAIEKTGPFFKGTKTSIVLYMRRNLFEYFMSRGFKMPTTRTKMPQHCSLNKIQCTRARNEMSKMSVHVPVENLRNFVRNHGETQRRSLAGFRQLATTYGLRVLYVPYERVVADKAESSQKILNFLGFEYNQPLEAKIEKRLQLNYTSFVKNYGDVRKALSSLCVGCERYLLHSGLDGIPESERDIKQL